MNTDYISFVRGAMGNRYGNGYPVIFIMKSGDIICHKCLADNYRRILRAKGAESEWTLEGYDIHWEGNPIECDECNSDIKSAYGPIETEVE